MKLRNLQKIVVLPLLLTLCGSSVNASEQWTAGQLGLYPISKSLGETIETLYRIRKHGLLFDQITNVSQFRGRPEYIPFLLHEGIGMRPRVRVSNYIGEEELFPSYEELQEKGDITSDDRENILQSGLTPEVIWKEFRKTPSHRHMRTWMREGLRKQIKANDDFRGFISELSYEQRVFELPINEIPIELRPQLLDDAMAALSSARIYRLRIEGNLLVGFVRSHDESPDPRLYAPATSHTAPPADFFSEAHLRRLGLLGVLGGSDLARSLRQWLISHAESAPSAGDLKLKEKLRPLTEEFADFEKARKKLIDKFLKISWGDEAAIRTYRRYIPEAQQFREAIAGARSARWNGTTARAIRAGILRNLFKITAWIGVGIVIASDSFDIYKASRGISHDQVSRKVATLATDLSLLAGLSRISLVGLRVSPFALTPVGWGVLALSIGTEVVHRKLWSDCPTLGDITAAVTECVSDTYLLSRALWLEGLRNGNTSRKEAKELRETYFPTTGTDKVHEPLPYSLVLELGDSEFNSPPPVVDLSLDAFDQEVKKINEAVNDPIEYRLNNLNTIGKAMALGYLHVAQGTLQLLGDLNPNMLLELLDWQTGFGAQLSTRDMLHKFTKRDEIMESIEIESNQFVLSFGKTRDRLEQEHLKKSDPLKKLIQHIRRVIYELETCGEITEFSNGELVDPPNCLPTDAQREAAKQLRVIYEQLSKRSVSGSRPMASNSGEVLDVTIGLRR